VTRLRRLLMRMFALVRATQMDRDLHDEIATHLAEATDDYVANGLSPEEARRAALRSFGGVLRTTEHHRDARTFGWVDDARQDVRYAVRSLSHTKGLTGVVILTLALGVGVNALVYSVVRGLIFRPLPVQDPERVLFVQHRSGLVSHAFPLYRELRDRNVTLDGLAGYEIAMMHVEVNGRVTHNWGYLATGNYFDLLGIRPIVGRMFHPEDDRIPGANPFAVLSYDYWRGEFAANPNVIGSTIRINRRPYTVLGVAPPGFYGTDVFHRPHI